MILWQFKAAGTSLCIDLRSNRHKHNCRQNIFNETCAYTIRLLARQYFSLRKYMCELTYTNALDAHSALCHLACDGDSFPSSCLRINPSTKADTTGDSNCFFSTFSRIVIQNLSNASMRSGQAIDKRLPADQLSNDYRLKRRANSMRRAWNEKLCERALWLYPRETVQAWQLVSKMLFASNFRALNLMADARNSPWAKIFLGTLLRSSTWQATDCVSMMLYAWWAFSHRKYTGSTKNSSAISFIVDKLEKQQAVQVILLFDDVRCWYEKKL